MHKPVDGLAPDSLSSEHFCEPSTSNQHQDGDLYEPKVKRSRSETPSSRLIIAESPENEDSLSSLHLNDESLDEPPMLRNCLVKAPVNQPPPILVDLPSKGLPKFIVLPKDGCYTVDANGCRNAVEPEETYASTSLSNSNLNPAHPSIRTTMVSIFTHKFKYQFFSAYQPLNPIETQILPHRCNSSANLPLPHQPTR